MYILAADRTVEEATGPSHLISWTKYSIGDQGYMRAVHSGRPGATISISSQKGTKRPSSTGIAKHGLQEFMEILQQNFAGIAGGLQCKV